MKLYPYQQIGVKFLVSQKVALLADAMGLGKSAQVITACDIIDAKRIFVLCPAVARYHWLNEFKRWSERDRDYEVVISKPKSSFANRPNITCICSYDLASSLMLWGDGFICDALVIDESHLLKSVHAKRTRAVFGKKGLCRQAKRIWCLSGTPMPNNPSELWPLLYTFGQTRLSYDSFVNHFCDFKDFSFGYNQHPAIAGAKEKAIPELKALLKPIMLRRKKEDVLLELPPISFNTVAVEPGKVDIEVLSSFIHYVYKPGVLEEELKTQKDLIASIDKNLGLTSIDGMRALEVIAKSVSTLRRYIGIQKIEPVAKLVAYELENNYYNKVVVFALHRDVIVGVQEALRKYKPVTLYGGTPPARRQQNIEKFTHNPRCKVFIGQINAAGVAISLTAASHVIFVEQDWTPANNAQAAMRCHRIGQNRPVFVRFAMVHDSIDEKVVHILRRKTRDIIKVLDEPKNDDLKLPAYSPDDTKSS